MNLAALFSVSVAAKCPTCSSTGSLQRAVVEEVDGVTGKSRGVGSLRVCAMCGEVYLVQRGVGVMRPRWVVPAKAKMELVEGEVGKVTREEMPAHPRADGDMPWSRR